MPHPEQEHSLRIQLATALRERDEALAQETYWHNRATEARESLAAANARADANLSSLHIAVQRAGRAEESLAAARRECGVVKESLREALAATGHDAACRWDYCMCWQRKARIALAAPAEKP